MAGSGLQCGLLALLAFLPIGGLALLTPEQTEGSGQLEFALAALLLSRFLTPPVAALIVAYLARKDELLPKKSSLGKVFKANAFPSIGLVLAVAIFGMVASCFLIVPGVAFLLATCLVLPVLVVEGVSSPVAIKRSWELTKDHRWTLLLFFGGYYLLSLAILSLIVWNPAGASAFSESLPLVQTNAFLPTVFVGALLYAGLVIASYEIYTELVPETSVEQN